VRDINLPLRKAYVKALNNIFYKNKKVGVYYLNAPDDITGKTEFFYIILRGLNNNESSTKNSTDNNARISIEITTWSDKYNDGNACDVIGNEVLIAIADKSLPMGDDDMQMVSNRVTNDSTTDYTVRGQRVYVDRTIIFEHFIYQIKN